MIIIIENLPKNMVDFTAESNITEAAFNDTVMPHVKRFIKEKNKLNYLLVLDTSIKNFSTGAWFKDALMGIKHLTKWNRAAIVTDVKRN